MWAKFSRGEWGDSGSFPHGIFPPCVSMTFHCFGRVPLTSLPHLLRTQWAASLVGAKSDSLVFQNILFLVAWIVPAHIEVKCGRIEGMNPSLGLIICGSRGFQRGADFIGLVSRDFNSSIEVAKVLLPIVVSPKVPTEKEPIITCCLMYTVKREQLQPKQWCCSMKESLYFLACVCIWVKCKADLRSVFRPTRDSFILLWDQLVDWYFFPTRGHYADKERSASSRSAGTGTW